MRSQQDIAFIYAHPDDEIFSCPGYLASVASDPSFRVTLLFCFEGSSARYSSTSLDSPQCLSDISARKNLSTKLADLLGVDRVHFLDHPNLRLNSASRLDLSKSILNYFTNNSLPFSVITHSDQDLNLDHCLVSLAAQAAFRPTSSSSPNLLFTNVLSSSEWSSSRHISSVYKDITPFLSKVKSLFQLYESECRPLPHPRNLETYLARCRISGSKCGFNYADAFTPLRYSI